MPEVYQSSSDDSSDSFQYDNHGMQRISLSVGLQRKWEAVERNLYQEDISSSELSTTLLNECKLWKESFAYLRVRGEKIDHPVNQIKVKLRHQVISTVVDQLIEKMSGEGLNLGRDNKVQRPTAPSKESYFERGKVKKSDTTQLPRSILKNSPRRIEIKDSTKKSHLPRISSKNNNWLARSERRCNNHVASLPPKRIKKIILPPLAQQIEKL